MAPQQQRFVYDKHTSYKVKDEGLRKERVREQMFQVWQAGRRASQDRETRQVRWQNGLEVRDESLCESHRSAAGERARARASLECVQQYFILIMLYIERSQVQGECVHDRRKGLGRNANRWCSRRTVEYDGNQVSTSNSNPGRWKDTLCTNAGDSADHLETMDQWTMSIDLVWWSIVDHATTVSAGI